MSIAGPRAPKISRGAAALAVAALSLLAATSLSALSRGQSQTASSTRLLCRNPASGATWSIPINLKARTADSFPARITDRVIVWHNRTRGGYYHFDRATGVLTVIYPSSTGGFSLRDECRFQP